MSTTKRKPLDVSAFASAALPQPDPVQKATALKAVPAARPQLKGPPSRANKVQIQGYFPEETRRRLKVLAAREGRSLEDLLGEAINDLLEKRNG